MTRLWLHALGYGLLLAVVTMMVGTDASFGSDDGAYGGQVHALDAGAWTLDRPLPVVASEHEGWLNAAITPDGPIPYSANPAYPLAMSVVAQVTPGPEPTPWTIHLVPLAGALGAAVTAWILAERLRPGAGPGGLWLVGLGPVLVNATTLWAHTASTALAGAAAVSVVDLMSDDRPAVTTIAGRAGLLASALTAAALIRTEAVLWIGAIAVTLAIAARWRPVAAAAGLVAAGVGGAAWLASRGWGATIRSEQLPVETRVEVLQGSPGWLASRAPAAWKLLASDGGATIADLAAVVAVVMAVYGAAVIGRDGPGDRGRATVAFGAAAALHVIRLAVEPGAVISGTLAAWPVVAALLVAGRARLGRPAVLLALAPVLFMTAAVLATQYAGSGGLQWGGRYLSMTFVPLAAVASAVTTSRLPRGAVAALAVLPAIAGVAASHRLHTDHGRVVAAVTAGAPDVVISDQPALARIAWTALPVAVYRAGDDDVDELLGRLEQAGVGCVAVHGLVDADLDRIDGYRLVDDSAAVRHLERVGHDGCHRPDHGR